MCSRLLLRRGIYLFLFPLPEPPFNHHQPTILIMVHVPATTAPVKTPGRRGRPPKHRDPVIPAPAADGSAPKPTFVSSLSFKGDVASVVSSYPPSPLPTPSIQQISTELSGASSSQANLSSSQPKSPAPAPSPTTATAVPAAAAASSSANNGNPNQAPIYEPVRGRAPRKSKSDAMAALTARSVSPSEGTRASSVTTPQSNGGPRSNGTASKASTRPPPQPTVPESPPVDFSHIKMPKRNVDPPRTTPRPFGIEDCPAFYPTAEEWKDPMAYVKSISDVARRYGICKIVPPEGWKMPFVIDTKVLESILSIFFSWHFPHFFATLN